MSAAHFLKHLPCYNFSRRFLHHSPSSAPLTLLSAFSLTFTTCTTPICPSASSSSSTSSSSSSAKRQPFTSPYLSVRVHCPKHVADTLSEALLCFGATSISVEYLDEDEEDTSEDSDEICIDSIFPISQEVSVCISQAADSIGLKEILNYEVQMVEHCNWVQKTQESFEPVEVTEGLWIVPEWRTPPNVQATNIILNPGLAFGTGEHPTTKLCLLLLQDLLKGGEFVLDYGTGSGILAIAALKFGAALSVGVDIDPQAIISARHNAVLNNLERGKLQLHLVPTEINHPSNDEQLNELGKEPSSFGGEVTFGKEKYDVVIANILLNPLLELADHIVSYAKPGAVVGISGILSEQLPQIIDRYSQFLDRISVTEINNWACVNGTKKRNSLGVKMDI